MYDRMRSYLRNPVAWLCVICFGLACVLGNVGDLGSAGLMVLAAFICGTLLMDERYGYKSKHKKDE